jgi:hypothetical protein
MKLMALTAMLIIIALMLGCTNKPKHTCIKFKAELLEGAYNATPREY